MTDIRRQLRVGLHCLDINNAYAPRNTTSCQTLQKKINPVHLSFLACITHHFLEFLPTGVFNPISGELIKIE